MRTRERGRSRSVFLGGGAEKLKRGDEHAEFVRKEKEKLKTAAAATARHLRCLTRGRKEGREEGRAEIIERCDHCFHSFLQAGFSLVADSP